MNNAVTIAGIPSTRITYRDRTVCTSLQLAQFYGCTEKNLSDNYANNRERFEEGKHFVLLDGELLREFKAGLPDDIGEPLKFAPKVMLWTDKGAARHAKMLTTDKAWEVFEEMEERYFTAAAVPVALTPGEMLLASAQAMIAVEQRQAAVEASVQRIEHQVEELAESRVWDHCPQNCEPISKIEKRINARYALPHWVIDQVVRQLPYSPKIAGMVRNQREEAKGSQYAVFAVADITRIFDRFVSECVQETATMWSHRDIERRFQLLPQGKKPKALKAHAKPEPAVA